MVLKLEDTCPVPEGPKEVRSVPLTEISSLS
jgi:hypothetical protein